jgi:RND family efflux transporter MFP subunit
LETEPVFSVPLTEFAAALLAERELTPRARVITRRVSELLPGSAVAVYVVEDQQAPAWRLKAYIGDISLDQAETPLESGTLGMVAEQRQTLQFDAADVAREEYAHLDVRQSIGSLAYVPILLEDSLLGCIEIVNFDAPLPLIVLESLAPLAECAAIGIATALNYEAERNAALQSITRLTQLYDIEKVFNQTLEMESLSPLICSKVQELTEATGVNLWMVDKDDMLLVQQAGMDPTREVGAREAEEAGIVGEVSTNGEPVLLAGDDPRMGQRNQNTGDTPIVSLMASALMEGDSLVGVLEVVSCDPAREFDDDQLFTLVQVSGSAAQALHNASLLEAERKVEILHTLVSVSQEIASTLNQDRVLEAVVNQPQRIIPYDRGAIALEERGSVRIKAISGVVQLNPSDPEVQRLESILRWVSGLGQEVHVSQRDGEVQHTRPETREKFKRYFEHTEFRGFFAIPLADEEGRLGILSFESSDPDFLTEAHQEIIQVLAGQATVALRNASLYKEVPFIDLLEPLLTRKRKFLALEKRRRLLYVAAVAIVFIFLAGFPLQLRVGGVALVAPAHTAKVQPEVAGLVQSVKVREGDTVRQGDVLAKLEDWQYRAGLATAEAKYQIALSAMDRALSSNDGTEAGLQRVEVELWKAEVGRSRELLERTNLRSPIDGRVATPHIEDFVGRSLNPGDTFAEVVNMSMASVDVAMDEADIGRLRSGEKAAIKLEGIPNRTFRAPVAQLSPKAELNGNERSFFARVTVANEDGIIRPGMQGRGKISTGWEPAGWVLFRRPAMWLWSKLWSWVGW